jgi:2-dehydropantoate 2-reductase
MEIESLVGVIRELGRLTSVPTPVVDIVYALISLRERSPTLPLCDASLNRLVDRA